jgi:hypothetical protein
VRQRWLRIGAVALGLFAVNVIARLVTVKGKFATEGQQLRIGIIAMTAVAVILIAASAWWSIHHPLGRVVADLGAAILIAALLATLIGPFVVHHGPFANGLGFVVGQMLLFCGIGAVGVTLGFIGTVAFGMDWKSQGLKRYAQRYRAKPPKMVRG